MLVLGHSGAGKTALLATLAKDYKLFIADFDNGLDILEDEKVLPPELHPRVRYKTFYNKTQMISGKAILTSSALSEFEASLYKWVDGAENLGNIYSWGPDVVFCLDSLTFLGKHCLDHVMALESKLGQKPSYPQWGAAMDAQEKFLELLYNPAVKCNVVVISHIIPGNDEMGMPGLFPSALGKKLPPKIGRYFNNMVMLEKDATGKRRLKTVGDHLLALKTSKPSAVLPLFEPDLAKLFKLLKARGLPPLPEGIKAEEPTPPQPTPVVATNVK
jgi:hypothetical protein